jgi:hypothetical protein
VYVYMRATSWRKRQKEMGDKLKDGFGDLRPCELPSLPAPAFLWQPLHALTPQPRNAIVGPGLHVAWLCYLKSILMESRASSLELADRAGLAVKLYPAVAVQGLRVYPGVSRARLFCQRVLGLGPKASFSQSQAPRRSILAGVTRGPLCRPSHSPRARSFLPFKSVAKAVPSRSSFPLTLHALLRAALST